MTPRRRHLGTAVAEAVDRKELRPVIQTGAQVMDAVFAHVEADPVWMMEPLFEVSRRWANWVRSHRRGHPEAVASRAAPMTTKARGQRFR